MQELPFHIHGRTCAGLLRDGRAMVTFRAGIGRNALWAWIGDPDDPTEFQFGGGHINDRCTVGLKEGALHIDSDGALGQFTQYVLRPPDTPQSTVDITVEVQVVANAGHAATLSVPYVGKFRIFPDRIELAHEPSVNVKVVSGEYHTYRVVRTPGNAALYVDGQFALETDNVDERVWRAGLFSNSLHPPFFGNEVDKVDTTVSVPPHLITPQVTGYSLWRRVEEVLDDPVTGRQVYSWSAASGEFPDQYQLDHIIEVGATIIGGDQGYSGWVELEDGRIFVVNYTDDTAPMLRYDPYQGSALLGIPWIRGTFLLPSDLPPLER